MIVRIRGNRRAARPLSERLAGRLGVVSTLIVLIIIAHVVCSFARIGLLSKPYHAILKSS